MSLERFSRRMQARAQKVGTEASRLLVDSALAADQVLVLSTPVDTGRARSNWLVSLDAPQINEIAPYAPGENLGRGETANAQSALNQGKAVIAAHTPGRTIFITNNVPYISDLNEGTSAQAPAMFVEAAVQAAVFSIASARVNTGKGL